MPEFNSKVRRITAEQYTGEEPHPKGICRCEQGTGRGGRLVSAVTTRPHVHTAHEQVVFLESGDWVVPEPDSRGYYPIKDDIFQKNYEPADELLVTEDDRLADVLVWEREREHIRIADARET